MIKMKKRIQALKAIQVSGKMGNVEGVIVTPAVADKLLNGVSNILLATRNMYQLSKMI
jgi:hypothetical protein